MKNLIVELHDVSPRHTSKIEKWVDVMPETVVPVVGVIPYHEHKYDIRQHDGLLKLFEKFDSYEIALHGFNHDLAEFSKLNNQQALKRIEIGIKMLSELGYEIDNFIAPNWMFGKGTIDALQQLNIKRTSSFLNLYDLVLDKKIKKPVINFGMGDIPRKVDNIWAALSIGWVSNFDKNEDMRLVYHPQAYPHLNQTIETIERLLEQGYKPITHKDFFN